MRKLTTDEWAELMGGYAIRVKSGEREGQAYMNALEKVNKDIYDYISATCADCYYKDSNIKSFIHSLNRGYLTVECKWCNDFFRNTNANYLGIYSIPNSKEQEEHWICYSCNVKYSLA
tara:strand:- start:1189 stop:1542 length:354 start_codon:yes stop_codon:yes gene_type:complete